MSDGAPWGYQDADRAIADVPIRQLEPVSPETASSIFAAVCNEFGIPSVANGRVVDLDLVEADEALMFLLSRLIHRRYPNIKDDDDVVVVSGAYPQYNGVFPARVRSDRPTSSAPPGRDEPA